MWKIDLDKISKKTLYLTLIGVLMIGVFMAILLTRDNKTKEKNYQVFDRTENPVSVDEITIPKEFENEIQKGYFVKFEVQNGVECVIFQNEKNNLVSVPLGKETKIKDKKGTISSYNMQKGDLIVIRTNEMYPGYKEAVTILNYIQR